MTTKPHTKRPKTLTVIYSTKIKVCVKKINSYGPLNTLNNKKKARASIA